MIAVTIIRPYKIDFIPAFFIMIIGTEFLIFATYIPLNYLYELCVPPKQSKKQELSEGDAMEEKEITE